MPFTRNIRKFLFAASNLNLSALNLALRKPQVFRAYLSNCLRKHDELLGRGLPFRNPLLELGPESWDTVTVPAQFQMGGGTSAREMLMLAAVTKMLKPKRIFEIGTYNGRTTAAFIHNAPRGCEVFTLDLPPDHMAEGYYIASDLELVSSRETEYFLRSAGLGDRCRQIYCDSMRFDPEPLRNSIELGFIDGAHSLDFVKNDTLKMAVMMSRRGFVFWHDYGGRGEFAPLTRYLETLPISMFRIRDTSLAWTYASEIKKLLVSENADSKSLTNAMLFPVVKRNQREPVDRAGSARVS